MEYMKLFIGLALLAVFTWILIKNGRRSGFIHTLFRVDTIIGIVAGVYLIFTSLHSLFT